MTDTPTGWKTSTLSAVTAKPTKLDPATSGRERIRYVDIGLLDGPAGVIQDAPEIVSAEAPSRCRQLLQQGDTLYSTVRPYLQKMALAGNGIDQEFASTGYCVLRPSGDILPTYLYYFTLSPHFSQQILPKQKGMSYPAVLDREVRDCRIWFPSVEEQRRIVEVLEDHLSHLDAATDYASAASKRLVNLHESSLRAALASSEVEYRPLGALLAMPLTNGRSVPTRDDGFPVLRLTALKAHGVDLQERKSGAWTASEARRFLVSEGDFLIARGNGSIRLVGRGSLIRHRPDHPVAFPDTIIRVRPNSDILRADYLDHVWNSHGTRRQIESMARTTAGIYKVNQKQLGLVQLPVPSSLDIQSTIAAAANSSREAVDAIATSIESAERRSRALRQAVLAAAFSGKLTGRHTDNDVIEDLVSVPPSWSETAATH